VDDASTPTGICADLAITGCVGAGAVRAVGSVGADGAVGAVGAVGAAGAIGAVGAAIGTGATTFLLCNADAAARGDICECLTYAEIIKKPANRIDSAGRIILSKCVAAKNLTTSGVLA
jgi:hypothetical protein